jgi:glycosidase
MKYLLLISCLFFSFCQTTKSIDKSDEIISLLSLESGIRDTTYLSDIFYADKYTPVFNTNNNITVKYLHKSNQIVLKPKDSFSGLSFIEFSNLNKEMVIPVKVKKKSKVVFKFKPDHPQQNMYVMGNFNNWNRHDDRMLDEDNDGIYEASVYLDDGIYEYQFVLDKKEIFDPNNPEKVDNGFGYFNSIKRVVSEDKKNAPNLYWIPNKNNATLQFALNATMQKDDIQLHVLLDNILLNSEDILIQKDRLYEVNINKLLNEKRIQRLRLIASFNNQPGNTLSAWIKEGVVLSANENALWQDGIIYSLMTDRFKNGNSDIDNPVENPELADQVNFNGGDFAGIFQCIKEGYFDSLGINTLWISPVNKTTNKAYKEWPEPHRYFSGYHGYWPVSSNETEPRFGSMQELKDLVSLAHEHKLKVLMDFISNHVHKEHPYFTNHRDWFGKVDLPNGEKNIRRWDEYRLTTWFDTFLPSFDYLASNVALQTMTDNAVWWLKETGVDGFRHDATKHVPYKFWRTLTSKIKHQIDPDRSLNIYQVGETFGGDDLIKSYVNNGMLDAQFNFNQFFVARRVFVEKEGNFEDLAMAIDKSLEAYGYNHIMGNIMDSHDQVRMMALLEGDLTMSEDGTERAWHKPTIMVNDPDTYKKEIVYLTYLLTAPGIPIIYYGDEFGMTGANDPDNRRMMRFGNQLTEDELSQLTKIRNRIKLRNKYSSLRRGDYKTLLFDRDVLAYTRGDNNERLIIVLNKGSKEANIELNLPEWVQCNEVESLISGKVIQVTNEKVEIRLDSYSTDILKIF